jgi:hypothetical protein
MNNKMLLLEMLHGCLINLKITGCYCRDGVVQNGAWMSMNNEMLLLEMVAWISIKNEIFLLKMLSGV